LCSGVETKTKKEATRFQIPKTIPLTRFEHLAINP